MQSKIWTVGKFQGLQSEWSLQRPGIVGEREIAEIAVAAAEVEAAVASGT